MTFLQTEKPGAVQAESGCWGKSERRMTGGTDSKAATGQGWLLRGLLCIVLKVELTENTFYSNNIRFTMCFYLGFITNTCLLILLGPSQSHSDNPSWCTAPSASLEAQLGPPQVSRWTEDRRPPGEDPSLARARHGGKAHLGRLPTLWSGPTFQGQSLCVAVSLCGRKPRAHGLSTAPTRVQRAASGGLCP